MGGRGETLSGGDRHLAFFSQADGRWVREWRGPVEAPPPLRPRLSRRRRAAELLAWLERLIPVEPGEIAVDVTHASWPVGDFIWARFDPVRMRVTWPTVHTFLVVDRASLHVAGTTESPRPVRSTDRHLVVDVTGTGLEPYLAAARGRFLLSATGGACFLPAADTSEAHLAGVLLSACAPVLLRARG